MNILRLIPEKGGDTLSVDQDEALVGRDPTCQVHLRDASVSRHHAAIRRNADEWILDDLNSGNGTQIDGVRTGHGVLLPGQTVQFGVLKFRVDIDRGDEGSTVILGKSPMIAQTMVAPAPPPPVAPTRQERPTLLIALAGIAGVVFLAFAAALFLYLRRESAREADAALAAAVTAATPAAATPLPTVGPAPAPSPAPTAVVTRIPGPRSFLLIATDAAVRVSVNGRAPWSLEAGSLRRLEVAPGEHLVRFSTGGEQREELVRVRASEQAVVRFASSPGVTAGTPLETASPSPSPSIR